ncbi:MAG: hypothetical protein OEN56_03585 [Gemmatimonadota bacterium]|nr:hypothetical protein [Gemmatimonadota bacterium]
MLRRHCSARLRPALVLLSALSIASGCGPKRLAVLGPLDRPDSVAESLVARSRLTDPTRIDFRWRLNESGSRVRGVGVARVEPPYKARLDLFLDNGETVIAAALVEDELRLPPGAPEDLLPPVDLMWGTLGVFRPIEGTRLIAGERLEAGARRLRYAHVDGRELDFELAGDALRSIEVVMGGSALEWVRLEPSEDGRYPYSATYRNLVDFRELEIERTSVRTVAPFDAEIWDPRE